MLILLFTEGIEHEYLNETILNIKNAKENLVPRILTLWGKLSENNLFLKFTPIE